MNDWPPIVDHVHALARMLLFTPLAPNAQEYAEVLNTAPAREAVRVQASAGFGYTVDDVMRVEAGS